MPQLSLNFALFTSFGVGAAIGRPRAPNGRPYKLG